MLYKSILQVSVPECIVIAFCLRIFYVRRNEYHYIITINSLFFYIEKYIKYK